MGNTSSTGKKNDIKKEFSEKLLFRTVNKISSDLILNTNNVDLLKFMNPEHCNIIINLTSNILNDNFTKNQLRIINNKIKKISGSKVDSIKEDSTKEDSTKEDSTKEDSTKVDSINIDEKTYQNYTKKNDICKEIAIYYVKIVHIFSAISIIIDKENPICNKTDKFTYEKSEKNKDFDISVSAKICGGGEPKKLISDNGIPELENLYKDEYIHEKKEFVMSDKQQKKYDKDVKTFYKSYTGNDKPDNIKTFSEIPLFDFKSIELCKKMKEKSREVLKGNSKNSNIINFANHLATIMNNSRKYDINLIKILNILFIPDIDGINYIINENISYEDIDEIIEKVRKIIIEIYLSCDKDYRTGIKLFETLLLDKNIELAYKRLNNNSSKNLNTDINPDYYEKIKKENDDIQKIHDDSEKILKEADEVKNRVMENEKKEKEEDKKIEDAEKQRAFDEDIYNKSIGELSDNYDITPEAMKLLTVIEKINNNKCPRGHVMERCGDDEGGICDVCDDDIEPGDNYMCCIEDDCDFDICKREHTQEQIIASYLKNGNEVDLQSKEE